MNSTHLTDTRFSDLPLAEPVQKALVTLGYEHCTPIQALTLPHLIKGHDIAGQAQTGTGKTIAFLTATVHHLLSNEMPQSNNPKAIIMAPTRELAIQIHNDAIELAKEANLRLGLVYGGEGYESQRQQLQNGVDILVGTTGRLIDYYKQGAFSLSDIAVVVLDEADRMFDLGFIKDIRYVFRRMPAPDKRLNMLFSATLSFRVQELAFEHMNEPTHLQVEPDQTTGHRIKEELFYPSNEDKKLLLLTLMEEEWPEKAIVFSNTKHSCETVHSWLEADGHRVGLLTGDVPQKRRLRILEDFTKDKLDVLVATDVAARGLHIPSVTHVFNYDLPDDAEDYVHRIGRTGRAGQSGHAISFACEQYVFNLPAVEEYIQHAIPVTKYDSSALLDDVVAPKRTQHHRRSHNNGGNSSRRGGGQRRNTSRA